MGFSHKPLQELSRVLTRTLPRILRKFFREFPTELYLHYRSYSCFRNFSRIFPRDYWGALQEFLNIQETHVEFVLGFPGKLRNFCQTLWAIFSRDIRRNSLKKNYRRKIAKGIPQSRQIKKNMQESLEKLQKNPKLQELIVERNCQRNF